MKDAMHAKTTDVLIAGAGPTGLTLACELLRLGIPAMVVDKQEAGANTSRAAVVHAKTLEVLEESGITERLLARGLQAPQFTVRDHDRVLASISFRELKTKYPFTLMCPQNQTEAILRERLAELGGEVVRPVEVVGVHEGDEQVQVTLQDEGGQRSTVQARWVVGCDGIHSTVRQQAGIEFEGGAYDERFVLADVDMTWPISREEACLFFSAKGVMVVAPLPGNHFRVVAMMNDAPAEPSMEDMQAILDERGPGGGQVRVERCYWSSRFHIQHRVAQQLRRRQLLLAGDAAHVHSPAGGQGMNTGIQDAVSLAKALRAVRDSGEEELLEEWERERLKVARGVVSMTDRMTRMATLRSPVGAKIRNTLISWLGHTELVSHALAERLAELKQ